MLTILVTILIGALLLLSVMVGGVWLRQERIAYQPPAEQPGSPRDARKIEYVAGDHQQLFGFLIEPKGVPAGILISFHGNADLASWQIPWAREVARHTSWCVFLAEYRGYAGLGGTPNYVSLRDDARVTWRVVQRYAREELRLTNPRFALFGHSLGSAVASDLASELRQTGSVNPDGRNRDQAVAALVLQSPFTSARDMARIVSTRPVQLLWKLIARVHYDNRSRLNDIDAPVWIAHGSRDWLVPVSMGCELFARARSPGRLLIVENAGHNDVVDIAGESYWQWIVDALSDRPESPDGARSIHHTETTG